MSQDRLHDLWARFLSGKGLSGAEEEELTSALQADPALRRKLLKDVQMDGLLREMDRTAADGESFTREFFDRVDGQQDGTSFLRRMESRLREEPARKPITRRANRPPSSNPFAPFLIAAAALFGIVLLFSLRSTGPETNPESVRAKWDAIRRQQAEENVRRAAQAHREAEARLQALRKEEERLAAELQKPATVKEEDVRKKVEADFTELLRKKKEEEAQLARLAEKAEEARAALTPTPTPEPQPQPQPQPKVLPRTETAIVKVERADAGVSITTAAGKIAARAGQELLPGQGLETGAGAAVLVYPDKTRMEIAAGTELKDFRSEGGKRLTIVRGDVRAVVSKQPANESMTFATPHGEATVLGTTLRLLVDPDPGRGTKLDVEKGKVELKNLEGKTALVETGHYAIAAKGAELASRPIPLVLMTEDFKDMRSLLARWEVPAVNPRSPQVSVRNRLEIDLSPRTADGVWASQAGLVVTSRQLLPLPVRVSMEVELSHNQNNLSAIVSLSPPGTDDLRDTLLLSLGDGKRTFQVGDGKTPAMPITWRVVDRVDAPGSWPRRERWTIDLKDNDLRFAVNGQEVLRRQHDKRVHPAYALKLEGLTMGGPVPQGTYVRFFNVSIEKLDK